MSELIGVKTPAFVFPISYVTAVHSLYPSGFGYAELTPEGIEVERCPGVWVVDDFMALQEQQKDNPTAYFFYKGDENTFLEDDVQPFTVLYRKADNGDQLATLVLFLGGNFSKFKAESGHTGPYHAWKNYFQGKIDRAFLGMGSDLAKLMEDLKTDPDITKNFKDTISDNGTIVFLAENQDFFGIDVNDKKKTFPWGWVTDACGYSEASTKTADLPANETPKEKLARLKAEKAAKAGAPITTVVAPAAVAGPANVTVEKTDTTAGKVAAASPGTGGKSIGIMAAPPDKIQKIGRVKEWYRNCAVNGTLPTNVGMRPEVLCDPEKLKKFGHKGNISFKEGLEVVAADMANKQPLILPAKEKKLLDAFLKRPSVLKAMGLDGNEIIDPKDIQKLEEKLPKFSEEAGMEDIYPVLRWPRSEIRALADIVSVDALVMLCLELRAELYYSLLEGEEEPDVSGTSVGTAM